MSILPIKIGEGPKTGGLISMSVGFLFALKPPVQLKSWDTKIALSLGFVLLLYVVTGTVAFSNSGLLLLLFDTDIKGLSDLRL